MRKPQSQDPKTNAELPGLYVKRRRVTSEEEFAELIASLQGCCKGKDSLVAAREREHREEDRYVFAKLRRRFSKKR